MTKILFPLRTSVEFFRNPTSVEAVARAKEASILYDEVVFEVGLYRINIADHGSSNHWRDPRGLTPEDLAQSRQLAPPGSAMQLAMGLQPGPNEPAPPEAMHVVLQGTIAASYAAEWHTGVVDELREIDREGWSGWVMTGGDNDALIEHLKQPRKEAEKALELAFPQTGDENPWLRSFLIKALARDAALAAELGAAMNVTELFAPLIRSLGAQPDPSGQAALGLLAPNVEGLTWEQIVEFRGHAGSADARGKLREFEERARESEPDDPMQFREKLFQQISTDLFAVIEDLGPKLGPTVGAQAAEFGVSFIPVVGPFLGPGASFAKALCDSQSQKHSWYAALMRLRDAAGTSGAGGGT